MKADMRKKEVKIENGRKNCTKRCSK